MADDAFYEKSKDYVRDRPGQQFSSTNSCVAEIMRRYKNGDKDAKSFVAAHSLDGRLF